MITLYVFAFLSGLITIAAPCIWPLLPIVLSASATGGKRKPLGITVGLIITFAIVTLSLSYVVKVIPLDPNQLRWLAVVIIIMLGLTLLVPALNKVIEGLVSRLSGKIGQQLQGHNQGSGFGVGLLTGVAMGIVWAPCAGPILATIATLAATQAVTLQVVVVTLMYSFGVGVPLFVLCLAGNRLFKRSRRLNKYLGPIQQVFGAIMIVTALLIATNYDKVLEARMLNLFPSFSRFVVDLESTPVIQDQLDAIRGISENAVGSDQIEGVVNTTGYMAPELEGITHWLNSEALDLDNMKGKVVLIDFWTYTCINCIRTLPHVQGWYEKYEADGLVVIGVHSPEFEFEKDTSNVEQAIAQYGLTYPVAQDNNFTTWRNYNNRYWPAEYLIDADGNIRYTHFGEGEYDRTESAIQQLLEEAGAEVADDMLDLPDTSPQYTTTPETYLGSGRIERFSSNEPIQLGVADYTFPETVPLHTVAFNGAWDVEAQYAEPNAGAQLKLHYQAADVFLVIEPSTPNSEIVVNGETITLDGDRLYTIATHDDIVEDTMTITFNDPGVQVFAFTFGD
jgi:cytochrome c biogenesis protein CcdA/thiol-disulfide isomerase/thioredoxin